MTIIHCEMEQLTVALVSALGVDAEGISWARIGMFGVTFVNVKAAVKVFPSVSILTNVASTRSASKAALSTGSITGMTLNRSIDFKECLIEKECLVALAAVIALVTFTADAMAISQAGASPCTFAITRANNARISDAGPTIHPIVAIRAT